MTTETKNALEQLRERLQGHARVQVCTLEAKDCAELVLLVDQALDDARALNGQKIGEGLEAMVARSLLRECIANSPGRQSDWRTRVERFLAGAKDVEAALLTHKAAGCACGGDAPWPSGPHEAALSVSLEPIVRRDREIDRLAGMIRFAEWGGRASRPSPDACPWCNNPPPMHAVLCPMFNGKGEIR